MRGQLRAAGARRDVRRPWTLVVLAALAGCRAMSPAPPELDRLLEQRSGARAPFERRGAWLSIESKEFSAELRASAIVATDGEPRLALQLHPPVGGKLLDLRVGPDGLRARWPQAGRVLEERWDASWSRGLETFLAASLLEAAAPLVSARVSGARREADGWTLALVPRLPGMRVEARLAADGRLLSRQYSFRGVRWSETPAEGDRMLVGRGTRIEVREESVEPLERAAASLFEAAR